MTTFEKKLQYWQHRLLDLGRRNKMIHYRETKRTTLRLEAPSFGVLFQRLVNGEESLSFQHPVDRDTDLRVFSVLSLLDHLSSPLSVFVGDIASEGSVSERQKTLMNMRSKARLSLEEQGINILCLSFGFLEWKAGKGSESQWNRSPLVLVPATLSQKTIRSPFTLSRCDDDITVNPTLAQFLRSEFGLSLPEFDPDKDSIEAYMDRIEEIADQHGWRVVREVSLGLLSFQKISMYNDLLSNEQRIKAHPVLRAMAGEAEESEFPAEEASAFDHDSIPPDQTNQVLSADSSQQDAIRSSKQGCSFVMQGPPGAGKSQTIANIIAEALADGKTVLFVSEKMAALQVVYRRLQEAHLGDFCLPLHSYKANKREILDQLAANLRLKQSRVTDSALADLDVLASDRSRLNSYVAQLHTPVPPLGLSLYDVYGRIEALGSAPCISFSFGPVLRVSGAQLQSLASLVRRYSLTLPHIAYHTEDKTWVGIRLSPRPTPEALGRLLPPLTSALHEVTDLLSALPAAKEAGQTVSFRTLPDAAGFLRLCSTLPDLPPHWLSALDVSFASATAAEAKTLTDQYRCALTDAEEVFLPSVRTFDTETWELNVNRTTVSLTTLPLFPGVSAQQWVDDCASYQSLCAALADAVQTVCTETASVSARIGRELIPNRETLTRLSSLLSAIKENLPLSPVWFRPDSAPLRTLILEARANAEALFAARSSLLSSFTEEILTLDPTPILRRYKTDYTGVFKHFDPHYRRDRRTLQALSRTVIPKPTDEEAVRILTLLTVYREKTAWFTENADLLSVSFSSAYDRGPNTDWTRLLSAFDSAQKVRSLDGGGVPETLASLLSGDHSAFNAALSSSIASIGTAYSVLDTAQEQRSLTFSADPDSADLRPLLPLLDQYSRLLGSLGSLRASLTPYLPDSGTGISRILSAIDRLRAAGAIEKRLTEAAPTYLSLYGDLFTGIETDWERILSLLSSLDRLKQDPTWTSFLPLLRLPAMRRADLSGAAERLDALTAELSAHLPAFSSCFTDPDALLSSPVTLLSARLDSCVSSLPLFDRYLDYYETKADCEAAGLGSFVAAIEQAKQLVQIEDAFLSGFYRLWRTAVLESFDSVRSFRKDVHEDTVSSFRRLDDRSLLIAQMRIREKLISRLPDENRFLRASDEVSVLTRELGKKRNFVPLRKLFRQIPNLLLRLKPCLMMSPLSVAHFLETEAYQFDLVIFDEASQIFPEDAIGAIFRGKQVIIAGDSRQLPPTDFFSSAALAPEGEDEEESGAQIVSDSILEEAAAALPSRTLLWHYRSRHESLISFSNRSLYHGSLITFPSPLDHAPDLGVETVFVENGVYEGGGRNCNLREAQECVRLVSEHIRLHPDRSLGIIAFSEKQQSAIEEAVYSYREGNPQDEWFFDESREEPFFVKNLENVQGDERDTILLSICYAHDPNGKMYMRFGPLGQGGGERRLNVAITRAKYNVKLVTSIRPSDIDLSRTDSEGVRLLRSYLAFAESGALPQGTALPLPSVSSSGTFCRAVAAFLSSNGYHIRQNVGTSDYQLDIAVLDPRNSERYLAGIECDGLSYLNARTARDRDHLRSAVLTGMGWSLYRVWSTAWICDPEAEKTALLQFLRTLTDGETHDPEPDPAGQEKTDYHTLLQEPSLPSPAPAPYPFLPYRAADLRSAPHSKTRDRLTRIAENVLYIVSVEQPIHRDVLYRRISPAFSAGKATDAVCRTVDEAITQRLSDRVTVDEDGFVRLLPLTPPAVRVPGEDGDVRPMEYVHTEEAAQAMLAILSRSFGLTVDDLCAECARVFGYERRGPKIRQKTDAAIAYLIHTHKIRVIDGKVQYTGGSS